LQGQHSTNLLYHLSKKHSAEHAIVIQRNELMDAEDENDQDQNPIVTANENENRRRKIYKIQQECVNLVTVHGRPFCMMEDKAFKNIIKMTNVSKREIQTINAHGIRGKVQQTARERREKMTDEFKNKLLSIKIDNATCRDRLFMAINAQYIDKGKIIIKNLGLVELHARSTSELLQEKLLYVLRRYHISVDQVYSITTDNGANMLKLVRLLNEHLNVIDSDDEEDFQFDATAEIVVTLDRILVNEEHTHNITSIRCAAHTLQLAVLDALREEVSMSVIEEARSLVRRLRTPTIKNILKAANKKKPVLDNITRWHSTLDMLESLVLVRDCCSTIPGDPLYLSENTWTAITEMISSLTPSKILTKILQTEQLTLGDFYYHWMKCYLDTVKIMVPLAQNISMHMETRKAMLMENGTFVSALYLDPRFHVVLSSEEIRTAVNHINTTWIQLLKVESQSLRTEPEEPGNLESREDEEHIDEMESLLATTERDRRQDRRAGYRQTYCNISATLENFSKHPRINYKENILNFWLKKQISDPQLYSLACIILATPATQVSVERLFSSLKFVLSALRTNLNDDIVEDILVIRNNK
jgi:hypothetical protein